MTLDLDGISKENLRAIFLSFDYQTISIYRMNGELSEVIDDNFWHQRIDNLRQNNTERILFENSVLRNETEIVRLTLDDSSSTFPLRDKIKFLISKGSHNLISSVSSNISKQSVKISLRNLIQTVFDRKDEKNIPLLLTILLKFCKRVKGSNIKKILYNVGEERDYYHVIFSYLSKVDKRFFGTELFIECCIYKIKFLPLFLSIWNQNKRYRNQIFKLTDVFVNDSDLRTLTMYINKEEIYLLFQRSIETHNINLLSIVLDSHLFNHNDSRVSEITLRIKPNNHIQRKLSNFGIDY